MNDDIDSYVDEGYSAYDGVPSDYRAPGAAPAPQPAQAAPPPPRPAAPRPPTQNFSPPTPRTGPMVSVLYRGLGDFDVVGRCAIVALSRVAWLFWSKVADGQTTVALGILELFRTLWNLKRDSIASGFIGHGQEHLPGILPAAEWSQQMRYAMAYSIAGATGFYTDVANVLARMPDNMAALPPWFRTLTTALPAADLPLVRTYVDAPLPSSGDPAVYYAGYVRDDLSQCGVPAQSPSTYTAVPQPPQPQQMAPFAPASSPSGGSGQPGTGGPGSGGSSSSGSSGSSGGGNIALLFMLALLGYGGYLAYQDSKPKEKDA